MDPGIHPQLDGPETIGGTIQWVEVPNDSLAQLDA
jgi:hypothetical protein